MGPTVEVMRLGDITAKFAAFGFHTRAVDGHDEGALDHAIRELMAIQSSQPRALVARTVKGKGCPSWKGITDGTTRGNTMMSTKPLWRNYKICSRNCR